MIRIKIILRFNKRFGKFDFFKTKRKLKFIYKSIRYLKSVSFSYKLSKNLKYLQKAFAFYKMRKVFNKIRHYNYLQKKAFLFYFVKKKNLICFFQKKTKFVYLSQHRFKRRFRFARFLIFRKVLFRFKRALTRLRFRYHFNFFDYYRIKYYNLKNKNYFLTGLKLKFRASHKRLKSVVRIPYLKMNFDHMLIDSFIPNFRSKFKKKSKKKKFSRAFKFRFKFSQLKYKRLNRRIGELAFSKYAQKKFPGMKFTNEPDKIETRKKSHVLTLNKKIKQLNPLMNKIKAKPLKTVNKKKKKQKLNVKPFKPLLDVYQFPSKIPTNCSYLSLLKNTRVSDGKRSRFLTQFYKKYFINGRFVLHNFKEFELFKSVFCRRFNLKQNQLVSQRTFFFLRDHYIQFKKTQFLKNLIRK